MEMNVSWFKSVLASRFERFKVEYRFFEEGDFGSLDQVIFESPQVGGEIGFWSEGWLALFIWDYENEKDLLNLLLTPAEAVEQERSMNELLKILKLDK